MAPRLRAPVYANPSRRSPAPLHRGGPAVWLPGDDGGGLALAQTITDQLTGQGYVRHREDPEGAN